LVLGCGLREGDGVEQLSKHRELVTLNDLDEERPPRNVSAASEPPSCRIEQTSHFESQELRVAAPQAQNILG